MITRDDLDSAIAECQGKRDPDSKTCMMLAAFYTIRKEMFGEEKNAEYSYAPAPNQNTIDANGDSEFARAIDGRSQDEVIPVIVELMEILSVLQPRIYRAVMNKIT